MNARRVGATAMVLAAAVGLPVARAIPPLPVEAVPCVSPSLTSRTVLLRADDAVRLPPDAREVGGIPQLHLRVLLLPTASRASVVARSLASSPGVAGVAVDRTVTAMRTPNDPFLPAQWALRQVGAPTAWNTETGRRNHVLVAVLDTGVDATHPELIGHVRSGGDFIDGDSDPSDEHGLGTAVSGVIAAATNNGQGVAGISWGATILAERVLDKTGSGSLCTVSAGIVDAVDAGARVLNMSLGGAGTGCPFVVDEALSYAHDHGALSVVSAGNDGAKGDPVDYPAGCDGAFAVAATDPQDRRASFSEYGPQIDISAPGVNVLTTSWSANGTHGYAYDSGTSLSAPIVSGAAALLLSLHPGWTVDQVRARLVATARDLGPRGRDDRFGAGRVDIGRALR